MSSSCCVCGTEEPKYKCPGCSRRTCSLNCVKDHKLTYSCNGRRSKAHFVSLSDFDTSTLISDYHLLEDIGRVIDGSSRDTRLNSHGKGFKWMRNLKTAAQKRDVDLHLAPVGLSVRGVNKSQVNYNKKTKSNDIHWMVDLIFPECGLKFTRKHVKEGTTLNTLLDHYIHPERGDPVNRYRLKKYCSVDRKEIYALLPATKCKSSQKLYHKLSLSDTLMDNLRGKTIIEYPVIHVLIDNDSASLMDQYQLVEGNHSDSATINSSIDNDVIEDVTINRDNQCPNDEAQLPGNEDEEELIVTANSNSSGLSLILSSYS